MRHLKPIMLKETYYLPIEAEIQRIFDTIFYIPLQKIWAKPYEISNSVSALKKAIEQGRVWYYDRKFFGTFNASISKELKKLGAVYVERYQAWTLPLDLVPSELKFAQATADYRFESLRRKTVDLLDNLNIPQLDITGIAKDAYQGTITAMESDLLKTLPKESPEPTDAPATARSRVAIEAVLSDDQKRIISDEWSQNLNLYIKGWMDENILKLREQVQPHVMAGGRAETIVKKIQDNYAVSRHKAKFLARQETALLMSKYQETRYTEMGITQYKWSDSHDQRVRHDHHELNGKIFSWDNPPITNRKTGARNNPGEDFNCRCVAIPVIV